MAGVDAGTGVRVGAEAEAGVNDVGIGQVLTGGHATCAEANREELVLGVEHSRRCLYKQASR